MEVVEVAGKKTELSIRGHSFESLKHVNEHGAEYWSARDLQPLLGYSQWRRFEQAGTRFRHLSLFVLSAAGTPNIEERRR